MNYDYLTEVELIKEVSTLAKQMTALSSQAEKLSELQKGEKVPSGIYSEIFNDLENKIQSARKRIDAVLLATTNRAKEVDEEASRLRTQLELLEVRHAIGTVPDNKYKVASEQAVKQLQSNENVVNEMEGLITSMQGCLNTFNRLVSEAQPSLGKAMAIERGERLPPSDKEIPADVPPQPSPQPPDEDKSCRRCGSKGPSTAHFCSNCGSRI